MQLGLAECGEQGAAGRGRAGRRRSGTVPEGIPDLANNSIRYFAPMWLPAHLPTAHRLPASPHPDEMHVGEVPAPCAPAFLLGSGLGQPKSPLSFAMSFSECMWPGWMAPASLQNAGRPFGFGFQLSLSCVFDGFAQNPETR